MFDGAPPMLGLIHEEFGRFVFAVSSPDLLNKNLCNFRSFPYCDFFLCTHLLGYLQTCG